MAAGANIARQIIQHELESEIQSAKAEVELLASQVQDKMAHAEFEAYESLLPKLEAIEQKLQELKTTTGAQWEQTKTDLVVLIAHFKGSMKEIESVARAN